MKIREPARGTPYLFTYMSVISRAPAEPAGRRPRMVKSLTNETPWLHGAAPRTMRVAAGVVETPSWRVMAPLVLLMVSAPQGLAENWGRSGGVLTIGLPTDARIQFTLTNSCWPVSLPDLPSRGSLCVSLPRPFQRRRSSSVSRFHHAEKRLMAERTRT